jgi:hypothetical protein
MASIRHPKVRDVTFSTAISSGFGALAVEEDILVLLELFFLGAGVVDALLAARHAVHRAET